MTSEFKVFPAITTEPVADNGTSDLDIPSEGRARVERIFGPFQILACAVTFMSSWEAASGNLYFVFLNGGPSALSWGLLITSLGATLQALSLAEMASMKPIAGAQYHWTSHLAPLRWKRFIAWMQAWLTWFAWISVQLSVTNVTATQLSTVVLLNHPTWPAPRWQLTLLNWCLTLLFAITNIFLFRFVPLLEALTGILHIVLWLAWILVLLLYSRTSFNSSTYVWVSTTPTVNSPSGWTSPFTTWNLGLLTSVWPYVGFDNAAHLSEEVKRAKQAVPRVMIWSIVANAALAWSFCLVLLYCVRSENDALNAPMGFPLAGITLGVTQSVPVTSALMALLVVITFVAALTCVTSTSRLTWAWARDGGLPGMFAKVHPRWRVPVNAILLPSAISSVLAVLNVPSTVAFQMFIALGSLGVYVSYIVAIACMVYAKLSRDPRIPPLTFGDWRMGSSIGLIVNVTALVYTCYMTVWLCFPTMLPVTGANMNYSLPILVFALLLAAALWVVRGNKWSGLSEKAAMLALREE